MIVKVRETRRLAGYGVCFFLLAHHDRGAAQEVSCGNDSLFREDEHRTRTFYFLIHQIDAFYEGAAHINE